MRGFCLIAVAACLSVMASAQTTADELIQAIRNNDLTALKSRLAKGAPVDTRDPRGTTLLMYAAAVGSPETVKLLLGSGADVNAKNDLEATALILGVGNPEKARMLVEKGADVNARSKLGRTPLMIAAGCDGCSATVKLLLDKGADPNATDKEGTLPAAAAVTVLANGAGRRRQGGQFRQRETTAGQGRGSGHHGRRRLYGPGHGGEQLQLAGCEDVAFERGQRQRGEHRRRG